MMSLLIIVVRIQVPDRTSVTDPGPSRRISSSGRSSPIVQEQSLFTPPPPSRRRTRQFLHYLAVPPFPKGLTRADYQPMFDRTVVPLPTPKATNALKDPSPAEPSVTKECTPQKRMSKERELDVVSSPKKSEQPSASGTDVVPSALLDAFYEHTAIPLYDDDTYPPLTTLDLATNSRFQFAHAWRAHASKLQEVEIDWMFKFGLLGQACVWAQSVTAPSPRVPGTAGYVTSEELRSWELVLPEDSPEGKSTKGVSGGQAQKTGSPAVSDVDTYDLLLPDDPLPGPSAPLPTNSTASHSPSVVDMERDMHQYLNGLGDSPAKHVPPRHQHGPTHIFRPHLLQSAGRIQTNSLGLAFPSSSLDPRLADTGDHECFLGVPPSPPLADIEPPTAPGPISDSFFASANDFHPSSSNILEASPPDAWSFVQGGALPRDNYSPPNSHVMPPALGTIDPSLLGAEQSQTPARVPKDSTPKRRSKLPEPVIYIRRPIDSSNLPLLSGKRPVQIKYRDSRDSPATPSTQTGSNQPSDLAGDHVEQPKNDADDPPRAKRRSAPSRKLREYHTASGSESDYMPETSAPKIKLKLKRPSLRDKESDVEYGNVEAKTTAMSYCHQCRNKSARPKMLCSNMIHDRVCGKRFCNRCILYRCVHSVAFAVWSFLIEPPLTTFLSYILLDTLTSLSMNTAQVSCARCAQIHAIAHSVPGAGVKSSSR